MATLMNLQDNFVDHETATLIAQLQREDVEALISGSKGKQKEGQLTDSQLALQLCLEDLNLFDLTHVDHQMACSVASAVVDDCFLIEDALNAEDQAREDHELALRIHNASDGELIQVDSTPRAAYEEELDGETLARIQARRFADMYGLRNPPWGCDSQPRAESSRWAASRKPVSLHDMIRCVACSDEAPWFDTVAAPCGDVYCAECLSTLFETSITDESLYPPRCCRQTIPFNRAKEFLKARVIECFTAKREELDTKNRIYCHAPSCSTFIPPSAIANDVGTCPSCARITCTMCKAAQHYGDCPEDGALQDLINTANAEGWQRCYVCARMVELELGCNHMTCICRAEFCYICGARWKTCECPLWEENRLVARAQRIHARRDNVRRSLHQPAGGIVHEEVGLPDPEDDDHYFAEPAAVDDDLLDDDLLDAVHFGIRPLNQILDGPAAARAQGIDDEELHNEILPPYVPLQPPPPIRPIRPIQPIQPAVPAQQVYARPAFQRNDRRLEDIVQNLRDNHECVHDSWQWVRGPHVCEECHHRLPKYIFECRQCELQACWRCRKNRL